MHWIALQPQPQSQPEALTALAWCALQFTPKVIRVSLGVGSPATEALLLEVSASERLFGGPARLAHKLLQMAQQHGFEQENHKNSPVVAVMYEEFGTSLVAMAKLQLRIEQVEQNQRTERTERFAQVKRSAVGTAAPAVAAIDALPLHTLAAARPHLATLARVGCSTWGDLRALPRGGVARRFGAEVLDALDRAYGLQPEIYPWLVLPEVFDAKLELQVQVETAPALLFYTQRLLKQLQVWMQLRHVGVTELALGWTMDARRNTDVQGELRLRTAQATQDVAHLQRLLGEHLARVSLPAPALYLRLRTLHTEPLAGASASLLMEDIQKGDSLHQMVERLTARLGPQNVLQLQTHADHRPERMQSWQPVTPESLQNTIKLIAARAMSTATTGILDSKMVKIKAKTGLQQPPMLPMPRMGHRPSKPGQNLQADVLQPTWLLSEPLALAVLQGQPHYQGPLALLAGPQRLEAGWWGVAESGAKTRPVALRDYFIARSEQAGLVWVYRERLQGQGAKRKPATSMSNASRPSALEPDSGWFLHGLFA